MSDFFSKKNMTEEDIKMKYITPAIASSGWDIHSQVKFEYSFTDGRVIVRGNTTTRAKKKFADYLLSYKNNFPVAIIEAKDNKHSVGSGMQQALEYAEILDIPFVYSTNGDAFLEHDIKNGTECVMPLDKFPSPDELWRRFIKEKEYSAEQIEIISQPYYYNYDYTVVPRYYQRIAINRTVEAVAKGQQRILLVMATGTGKTYTAFQIIHRLHSIGLKSVMQEIRKCFS